VSLYLLFFFFSYRKEIRKEAKEKEKIKYKLNQVSAYLEMLTKKPHYGWGFLCGRNTLLSQGEDTLKGWRAGLDN